MANDRLVYIGLTSEFPAKPDTVRSHHLDGTTTILLNSGLTSKYQLRESAFQKLNPWEIRSGKIQVSRLWFTGWLWGGFISLLLVLQCMLLGIEFMVSTYKQMLYQVLF